MYRLFWQYLRSFKASLSAWKYNMSHCTPCILVSHFLHYFAINLIGFVPFHLNFYQRSGIHDIVIYTQPITRWYSWILSYNWMESANRITFSLNCSKAILVVAPEQGSVFAVVEWNGKNVFLNKTYVSYQFNGKLKLIV